MAQAATHRVYMCERGQHTGVRFKRRADRNIAVFCYYRIQNIEKKGTSGPPYHDVRSACALPLILQADLDRTVRHAYVHGIQQQNSFAVYYQRIARQWTRRALGATFERDGKKPIYRARNKLRPCFRWSLQPQFLFGAVLFPRHHYRNRCQHTDNLLHRKVFDV